MTIDASSVVWSVIDSGKLANQIARLVATVDRYKYLFLTTNWTELLKKFNLACARVFSIFSNH